ncbi:hypothetical protein MTO96_009341 [Rhipicephalus appendiculatus]
MSSREDLKLQSTSQNGDSEQRVLTTGFRYRKWAYISVVGAGAALSVILTATALIISRRYKFYRDTGSKREVVFCCKDDAELILSNVNHSGNACEDFYEYVCSRAEGPDSGFVPPALKVAMAWKLIEVAYMDHGVGATQRVLRDLRRSLASWLWLPREEQIADLMVAVLNTGNVTASMNSLEILRFFASMSLKYGLRTVVNIETYPANTTSVTTLRVKTYTGCLLDADLLDSMNVALRKFNDHTNSTVSNDDVRNFTRKVNDTILEPGESDTKQFRITAVPIHGITFDEWQALLKDFVFATLPNVTTLSVRATQRLADLIQLFSDSSNQPAAIACVTVCSAIHSVEYLRTAVSERTAQRTSSSVCEGLGVCRVDDIAKTEAVWSESLDVRIRELFSLMRSKVCLEAIGANVMAGSAKGARIEAHLDKLRLMLPMDVRNAVSSLTIPHMSGSFGLDLLAARGHNFEMKRIQTELNIPDRRELAEPKILRRRSVIYISNNLYLFLDPHMTRDSIVDLAALGVGLAMEIWSFLLEDAEPGSTRQFVESHYHCFRETYFSGTTDDSTWRRAFYTALGLASAVNAGKTSDWSYTFNINDTFVSKGQLVYLYWILSYRLARSTMLQASSAIFHARQPNDTRRAVPVLNVASSRPFQPIFAGLIQPEDAQCHLRSSFDGYLNCPPTLHPGVFAHVKHKYNVM